MKRKFFLFSIGFLMIFSFTLGRDCAWAGYPEKAIRFIVVFPPGGMSDLTVRALAEHANPYLDRRIYVENVGGAGGSIGWREAAKAAPDGYTVALLSTAITVGPNVRKNFPTYDLFDALCILHMESRIIVTKWDSPFKTAADLISYAKKNPGAVTVGTGGIGTIPHFGIVAFSEASGAKVTVVPFKGGGPGMVACMGGHVACFVASGAEAQPYMKGKKIRGLVTLGSKRYRIFPDVPTAKELGYDVDIAAFAGVGVPKGTPKEVKDILVQAFTKATEAEGYRKILGPTGLELVFIGPEEAQSRIKNLHEYYKSLSAKIGLKPE